MADGADSGSGDRASNGLFQWYELFKNHIQHKNYVMILKIIILKDACIPTGISTNKINFCEILP